ncbi:MAG: Fe-S cluster assembly protein SufD [Gammaproteobacteria bacterium]|nr:Fe-S cluster assembly protein SufD [Gammaproteobacteria bacterium]
MATSPVTPVEEYQSLLGVLPGQDLAWLRDLRDGALRRFSDRGYPTPRDEAWKYTNIAPLLKQSFIPSFSVEQPHKVLPTDIATSLFADADMPLAVFVDGAFNSALSNLSALPPGVELRSLREVLDHDGASLESLLVGMTPQEPHGFIELNTAFMFDGACVRIAPDTVAERPLHLLYVSSGAGQPVASYLRNLMIAGRGSRAAVIEHYVSLGDAAALCNVATHCMIEPGAALEHYKLNEEGAGAHHFAGLYVEQARDSRYVSHNVAVGGRMIRNDLRCVLAGEGAECVLNGLYLGRGREHIDNQTSVEHRVPHCSSREWYKGVLDGRARGVFSGHVMVRQDAQKTDAQQMNNNLLLSDEAEVDTRPQLEIYADDVKCSHGSTVGQLNPDVLFYLRARGIDEIQARRLLVTAFAQDVVGRMAIAPVREWAERLITARLAR